jgi:BarA-like signal transduction histidine kinase
MFTQKKCARVIGSFLLVLSLFVGISLSASTASVAAGQAVMLSATANGTAPFTYQWYKDGSPVSGATASALSISNFQVVNTGTYSAVVANSAGSAVSDNAILNLATLAPVITTQPASQIVTQGASVTFTASASGSPAPAYQWTLNGTSLSGANNATLTVANIQAGNAGTYNLVATNSAGSVTSNPATLIVNPAASAPVITTQPTALTVTAGGTVTFTAAASGLPSPTYQWLLNGSALAGANASTLTIANAQAANAGSYSFVATNVAGFATSSSAVLTVNPASVAPSITTQPINQTVTTGSSVTFTASASGLPSPTYQWLLNGTALAGANASTLTIANAQAANAGSYSFVATNVAGFATSSPAVLTVNPALIAPSITTQPINQSVKAGASVTFIASASGLPSPTLQWLFNGTALPGANSATLTIANVQAANAGSYALVATNVAGSASSSAATLTVNAAAAAPVITTQPASQSVTVGSSVTFTVVATGSPAPTFQWRKNGRKIAQATDAAFTLASAVASDAATYSVAVSNASGTVTSNNAVLTVHAARSPLAYRVDFDGDGQSDLLWQNSVTGECAIWLMNGTAFRSSVSLGTLQPGVQIRGTGDFNGDGKLDILWQNTLTGKYGLWVMAGTTISSNLTLGQAPLAWQLCGTGDFNGDGKSDIVLRNSLTGECKLWLMAGTAIRNKVSLGLIGLDWQMAGTGDLNKDGQSDLLWQNSVTGEVQAWLMAGTGVASVVSLGSMTLDWQLCGTADINGDQQSDVLWQNLLTGACQVWIMNGTTVDRTVSLLAVPPDWMLRN